MVRRLLHCLITCANNKLKIGNVVVHFIDGVINVGAKRFQLTKGLWFLLSEKSQTDFHMKT